jgi:small ligand-binding sensory domain FIST
METRCTHEFSPKPYTEEETVAVARRLREKAGRPCNLAFVFTSGDYLPHLSEFCDALRVEGHIINIAGCTGSGLIGTGQAQEAGHGFSVLGISAPDTEFVFEMVKAGQEGAMDAADAPSKSCDGWIALLDPFVLPVESWLANWNTSQLNAPVSGGLASSSGNENTVATFWNGKQSEAGVVCGWRGGSLRAAQVLSQGCRPIGEPLTVTRAENNIVFSLGSQPAYEVLESAFQTLSDEEKAVARGNLLAGLATNEYLEDFGAGDFLIRNIIGADPNSGAVVIGATPRIGQTLQYHFRDRRVASLDLQNRLVALARSIHKPLGGLLFSCIARGKAFFGDSNHDPARFKEILGDIPLAGFFCNGEIGPVRDTSLLTGFSSSMVVFYDET